MNSSIQMDGQMSIFGIPIVTSPYVPKAEHYEADYSRPLFRRLLEGRTVDLREWETDQVFLIAGDYVMSPETCAVLQGLEP